MTSTKFHSKKRPKQKQIRMNFARLKQSQEYLRQRSLYNPRVKQSHTGSCSEDGLNAFVKVNKPFYTEDAFKEANGSSISLKSFRSTINSTSSQNIGTGNLEIYVDGPYGAPAEHFFEAEHAVLISSGIGVTPFASILQTIMLRYKSASHTCPNCNHSWIGNVPFSLRKLQKVDFFWINRDQEAFEWFISLLTQLELEQSEQHGVFGEHFLDMHIYMTSALKREDMKALSLQIALELIYERKEKDLITGLKTRTKPGRPNWNQVFRELASTNYGKISVFYCGNPALGNILKQQCRKYAFDFRSEKF